MLIRLRGHLLLKGGARGCHGSSLMDCDSSGGDPYGQVGGNLGDAEAIVSRRLVMQRREWQWSPTEMRRIGRIPTLPGRRWNRSNGGDGLATPLREFSPCPPLGLRRRRLSQVISTVGKLI